MSKISASGFRGVTGFLKDQQGAGTIMDVVWFAALVGVCGVAVDMTNAYRVPTVLQATADASARPAAIYLPVVTMATVATVTETVAANAQINTPIDPNGEVVAMADVVAGEWDHPRHRDRLPVPVH